MPLRINTPTVVGQVIDGEAVVINLQNGAYYSLVGSAAAIWEALERELPPALHIHSLVLQPMPEAVRKKTEEAQAEGESSDSASSAIRRLKSSRVSRKRSYRVAGSSGP